MKISYHWLKEWISMPLRVGVKQLSDDLTMAGLEVDRCAPPVSSEHGVPQGVLVAQVVEVLSHPNADKLQICVVQTGPKKKVRVVCGAPDIVAGAIYAYAPPGAIIAGQEISEREVRGENSVGMLCSGEELGLGDYHGANLLRLPDNTPLGTDLQYLVGLDDTVISMDITPNRGDCLSAYGLACEIAALYNLRPPKIPLSRIPLRNCSGQRHKVRIRALDDCSSYMACVVKDIDMSVATPLWMKERLRRSGMRSVNIVVDICNYVMLDIGQPMHAFDLSAVDGAVMVRRGEKNDELELIDGAKVKPTRDDLVIADSKKVLALAGVMGGRSSAVSDKTKKILLESACFNPKTIAGKARRYNVQSEAAYRFERGVDPKLAAIALRRCVNLLLSLCANRVGPVCAPSTVMQRRRAALTAMIADLKTRYIAGNVDAGERVGLAKWKYHWVATLLLMFSPKLRMPQKKRVSRDWHGVARIFVRYSRVAGLLGLKLSRTQTRSLLRRLGARVFATAQGWYVAPPSRRRDLVLEEDILEEIARLHGYDQLPDKAAHIQAELASSKGPSKMSIQRMVADRLVGLGYQEVINYSLVEQDEARHKGKAVLLSNWVSQEMSALRTSLLPGLLDNLYVHQCRQVEDLRLFEIGNCFSARSKGAEDKNEPERFSFKERPRVAMLLSGGQAPKSWDNDRDTDFYDLKADVLGLLSVFGREFKWSRETNEQSRYLFDANRHMLIPELNGVVGVLSPVFVKKWDLKSAPMLAEFDLDLAKVSKLDYVNLPSPQPALSRDLSIVVDKSVPQSDIHSCIVDTANRALEASVNGKDSTQAALDTLLLFDVYEDSDSIGESKKALAYHVQFRHPNRALLSEEADSVCEEVVRELSKRFQAQLRQG